MRGVGRTDTGLVREQNEDVIYISDGPVGALPNLYIISDGMGGHQAGEVASRKSVDFFIEYIEENAADEGLLGVMAAAVRSANARVYGLSLSDERLQGMGATFSAAVVAGDTILTAHVGDSRIYLADKDGMRQITVDHSLVQSLVEAGRISRAEAFNHPQKNIVTRAMGTDIDTAADCRAIPVKSEGVLLLCSDGLTDMVHDNDIFDVLKGDAPAQNKADSLIDMAYAGGGIDNISVILAPVPFINPGNESGADI